jgi:DNA modification methylase
MFYYIEDIKNKVIQGDALEVLKNIPPDPMAGTGTTGCAAKMLGRDFVMIERNPQYVQLIKERLSLYA